MRNQNNQANELVTAGTAAVAAASKTPFMTAFKITLGISAAQLVVLGLFVLGAGATATVAYLLLK